MRTLVHLSFGALETEGAGLMVGGLVSGAGSQVRVF